MSKLVFPKGFLWGSATSANQTEGNNKNSDWWIWENSRRRQKQLLIKDRNPDDFKSGIACDSYNRYEEDFDIVQSLNQNIFRMTIEWARIQPRPYFFDIAEIEHYRTVLQALKKRGIKIFVTLHHFSSPAWFGILGGWAKRENVNFFVVYAERIFDEYGDLIDYLSAINEPNLYAFHGYVTRKWMPQVFQPWKALRIINNFFEAHKRVYILAKKKNLKFMIGTTHAVMKFEGSFLLSPLAKCIEYMANTNSAARQKNYYDFIGIQYYTRVLLGLSARPPFIKVKKSLPVSDMGWEIYPQGLYYFLKKFSSFGKPIIITENGIADAHDTKRKDFIQMHLQAVHKAISEGVDVRGYLYWSLLDNLELADGYQYKFGLVEVDRNNNLKRIVRESAKDYALICKNNYLEINNAGESNE